MRGGAGVSKTPEKGSWYPVAESDAKLATKDGRVVALKRVSRVHGSVEPSADETSSSSPIGSSSGVFYGGHFKPSPEKIAAGDRVADPVMLTGLTKSGNTTGGWTLSATWSGGTAPYTMVSSTDPSFQKNVVTNAAEFPAFNLDMKVDSSDPGKFFNVVDSTTVSPAVQGSGFNPLPAPKVSSSSATNAWWGDSVTLTGKYFDPIAEENLAFINDLGVKASSASPPASGSSYSTSVTFEIPEDARSFAAAVDVHGKSDHSGLFGVYMSPSGIGPYTNITGVSWSPQTGHVWVAAQGVVEDVDLFEVAPTAVSVTPTSGSFSRPYVSRVTTGGTILVVDRDADLTITEIDVNTHATSSFASTVDDSFTRDIDPVGIAVDPGGSVAYVADASTGRVVRIPRNAGPGTSKITDQWGGRSFSFVDPVGIDVVPGLQVIIADNATQWTWQLTGPSTALSQHWAGQNVHSIEVDRGASSADFFRYVIDTATGMTEAFNRNPIGSNPPQYHGGRVYGLADGTLRLNYDWVYGDLRKNPKKVLLSNAVSSFPYPTQFQTTDRVIELKGEAWNGVPVHLRLIDPPDFAPYAPAGGWTDAGDLRPPEPPYEGNDNVVWGWAGGEDYGLSTDPNATSWHEEINVTPGADNTYTYYLKVPPDVSGENFQVEMTKCDPNGNILQDQVVGMSGVYTSWKRIFIERDKMFRTGGVLAADFLTEPGTCGPGYPQQCCGDAGALPCNQVKAYQWTNVTARNGSTPGDTVAFFDETRTFENGQPESREILAIGPDVDGVRIITLSADLTRNYLAPERTTTKPYQPTFAVGSDGKHHSAGYGVVSGCDLSPKQINQVGPPVSCFYEADMRGIEKPFGDAFVEFFAPRDGMGAVPYVDEEWFNYNDLLWLTKLSRTWFSNFGTTSKSGDEGKSSGSSRVAVPHDYFQVVGVSSKHITVNGNPAVELGQTQLAFDCSFLFRGSAEEVVKDNAGSDPQKDTLCQHTAVHELGHQFNVNGCVQPPGTPHDSRLSWCGEIGSCEPGAVSPQQCVMDTTAPLNDRWDVSNRFCKQDLFLGDPTCSQVSNPTETTIRRQHDPY